MLVNDMRQEIVSLDQQSRFADVNKKDDVSIVDGEVDE
jgi:hypothetical protein